MRTDYILYGADHSYFTGKVRPYFRYKALNYREEMATIDVYKQIILPNVGAPIIPVMATSTGEVIQDTTDIIDYLEARHPPCSIYPEGPKQKLISLLLEQYGDEWLTIPAMHYRWSVIDQQYDFIMREFGRLSRPDASAEEQIELGEKLCAPFRNSCKYLGITEETIPEIERVYAELLDQLNAHFLQQPFLLGSKPSIGDFGLVGPLYAHLGRDPVPKAIMAARAPAVMQWIERMNNPQPLSGEFLADDEIPETLLPILRTLSRDFLPDVLSVIEHNANWLKDNPEGENIPRYLGMHSFQTGNVKGQRLVNSFSQWMFQRSWQHYQSLDDNQRRSVDSLLEEMGALQAMNVTMENQLARKTGQLELVKAG